MSRSKKTQKDDEGDIWVGGQRIYPDPTKRELSDSDDDWLNQDYGFGTSPFYNRKNRQIESQEEE